jgi:chondroitin 4-sulfotransferase 11
MMRRINGQHQMKDSILAALPRRLYLRAVWLEGKYSQRTKFDAQQQMRAAPTAGGYTYKPFDDTRSIFVHIPKCAGVSVANALYGNGAGGHATFDDYLRVFEPRAMLQYFKFTVVRNPWDRLVSAFHFLKGGGFKPADRVWADAELGAYDTFDDFVRRWVNDTNIWKWYHFQPQYHYMIERRQKIALDFIGMVENIDEDFAYIANRVGVDCSLPQTNRSDHSQYTEYYCSTTKQIVADVYRRDISLLGYSFDNSSVPEQIANRKVLLKRNHG